MPLEENGDAAADLIRGSSILITGGTGSFGQAFVKFVTSRYSPKRVVVFSRDELKQHQMKTSTLGDAPIRWFLGDVRDRRRLDRALQGIDFVVHAAALKQVDTAEYNPYEFVQTNVLGSQNVIDASIDAGVKRVLGLSTDKASSPINLYGATKLTADKLFVAGNHYASSAETRLAVVRYGNVMGSRGSVIPLFRELASKGNALPITDPRMTRFWITMNQAVEFVLEALVGMQGGEIFVPKIPSVRILDLIEVIAPGGMVEEVGIRPGEKLHEEMISRFDAFRTIEQNGRYVISPTIADWGYTRPPGVPVTEGFEYTSDTNSEWLTKADIESLIEREERP